MKKTNLYGWVVWLVVASAGFFVGNVQAMDFTVITAEDLKFKMDSGEKLLLINPLSDIEFNAQHIPGSVNIPLQNLLVTERLPKNRDQLIVTYCLGRK